MPMHDFECLKCGHVERDLYYRVENLPKLKRCPKCKKKASRQIFDAPRLAQINPNASQIYGKWNPHLGGVIRDRAHKQELMKRYGWTEAGDPVGGNRKLSEEVLHADSQQKPPTADGMEWGDREMAEKAMGNPHQGPVRIV